jgi:outer membrane immunogenic protein
VTALQRPQLKRRLFQFEHADFTIGQDKSRPVIRFGFGPDGGAIDEEVFTRCKRRAVRNAASAADLPLKAPPISPQADSWTGFYIGGDAGAAWTGANATWTPLPAPAFFGANAISAGINGVGFLGGFHAGYDWQFASAWVAGLEGDWASSHTTGSFTQPLTVFGTSTPVAGSATTMSSTLEWLSSFRGRAGYLVTPNLLAYGTAGAAWARLSYAASATVPIPYASTTGFADTSTGFVVGAGLTWALTANWSIRGEYLFYRFDSAQNAAAPGTLTLINSAFPSAFSWSNANISVGRAGVSYKF